MAFIMCDDHNLSIEADGMDPTTAKRLMLGAEAKPDPTPLEKQIIDFGRTHRDLRRALNLLGPQTLIAALP